MLPRHIPTWKANMPDELDDVATPDDLDELDVEDLDDLDDEVPVDEDAVVAVVDEDIDDELVVEVDVEDDVVAAVADPVVVKSTPAERTEEGEEEDEEEPEDEDVEASLDVILKERLVVEDEPEDEELAEVDDRSEQTERVRPKQPDEFVCRSCFLVKHPSQLADPDRMLCRDCV